MSILPRRYLRPPRFHLYQNPRSRLSNPILAFLIVALLDAYWTVYTLPSPIRTITLPSSIDNTTPFTSNSPAAVHQPSPPSSLSDENVSNNRTNRAGPESIFIASIFRNSEYMLRKNWTEALLALATHLGPQNVYVSVVESGSMDDTKGALVDLDGMLGDMGVGRTIALGMDLEGQLAELARVPGEGRTEKSESGWEMRRIPYLARLRNQAMEPLLKLWDEGRGRKFDKVLWINDVVFTTEDVTTLLSTNSGSYAAACSLDFSRSHNYYDTFALRDSLGYKTTSLTWPYFYSCRSLTALKLNQPVPVKSCWNGMVVFDAEPFYPSPGNGSGKAILRFRGTSDSLAEKHVEGSECCFIHADNDELRKKKGVWLNPNVKTAYSSETYDMVNAERWPQWWQAVVWVWKWRVARVGVLGWGWAERWVIEDRVRRWEAGGAGRVERGRECLINEMQILYQSGWQHV
ncbi:polysaccharide export protein [Rutstroemia sp. NJR-2017a BBW]|nr:polysaccharide export protein [Rutstroemia sp. NJR-2017a BBW]